MQDCQMDLFITLIRVMVSKPNAQRSRFPFLLLIQKKTGKFKRLSKGRRGLTFWFNEESLIQYQVSSNWEKLVLISKRQKLLDYFVYFKVKAPTYGHPINNSGLCHLSYPLNYVFYFPLPYSSPPKCLKALENKDLLNNEGRRNRGRCEANYMRKPKDIKTHERRLEGSCNPP